MGYKLTPLYFLLLLLLVSCKPKNDPVEIIQNTIRSIDSKNSISYKQKQFRGETGNIENQLQTKRTFYYKRLISDSIIGAKAHIYFYDSSYIFLEDIYDGNKLIRKNNRDSSARVYDLIKYPAFRKKHFWGKTTPYIIQYMLKYAIENKDAYTFEMGQDSMVNGKICYYLKTILKEKALMPGFHEFEIDTNRIETMILFIDPLNFFPQRMRMEVFFIDNPDNIYYVDNTFYDLNFNPALNDSIFNTSDQVIKGFRRNEIKP